MLNFVPNFFIKIVNVVYPPKCILCGKYNDNFICDICRKRIKKYEKFYLCNNTNRLLIDEVYFDKLYYCYTYKGLIRTILINYKFNNKSYFCNFFAKMLLNCKKTYGFFSIYDIIIPVPMDKQKQLIRGYNQTVLITDIIAKNTQIINGKDIIKKVKKTETQSTLNEVQRKENVKNAFGINDVSKILNKKIILFDDIYTTGATVNEISKLLKQNGAKEVLVLVLAKD